MDKPTYMTASLAWRFAQRCTVKIGLPVHNRLHGDEEAVNCVCAFDFV